MELHAEDIDVFGYVHDDKYISIQVFHIRSGKTAESVQRFSLKSAGSPEEMLLIFWCSSTW